MYGENGVPWIPRTAVCNLSQRGYTHKHLDCRESLNICKQVPRLQVQQYTCIHMAFKDCDKYVKCCIERCKKTWTVGKVV